MHNLQELTGKIILVCKEAGEFIRGESEKINSVDVITKDVNQFVTRIDISAEELLVKKLKDLLPEAGFTTEEKTIAKTGKNYHWVIDPLDGTTNFIHGVPVYSVSVALMTTKNIPLCGVVYEINKDECFSAWKDGGAYLNGKEIQVSKVDSMHDSLIATGFPYYDYSSLDKYLQVFRQLMKRTRGLRRLGSAAVDLSYVACGRFDSFYEYGLNIWDIAAGILIVKEAGGHISDFSGSTNFIERKEILASNTLMHNNMMNIFNKYFA